MKSPAIYFIKNTVNGKVYVGSAQHAPRRLWEHRYFLRNGCHYNHALQGAWDKHGADAFDFGVLERVDDPAHLLQREQHWISHFSCADGSHGYNLCPVAGTRKGCGQPESFRIKMRSVHLGKAKTAEHRAKISAGNKGKVRTEEMRQRTREATQRQFSDHTARQLARENAIRQFADPAQRQRLRDRAAIIFNDPVVRSKTIAAVSGPGKRLCGDKNKQCKISDSQVAEARFLIKSGWRQAAVARKFFVSQGLISKIMRGLSRSPLSQEITPPAFAVITNIGNG